MEDSVCLCRNWWLAIVKLFNMVESRFSVVSSRVKTRKDPAGPWVSRGSCVTVPFQRLGLPGRFPVLSKERWWRESSIISICLTIDEWLWNFVVIWLDQLENQEWGRARLLRRYGLALCMFQISSYTVGIVHVDRRWWWGIHSFLFILLSMAPSRCGWW
jgi:hypothetical protein